MLVKLVEGRRCVMTEILQFSQLSSARQTLVRVCQALNFGNCSSNRFTLAARAA